MLKNKWLRTNIVAIDAMVKAGYSRTKIYNISRDQGWSIRKTDELETLRHFSGITERARSVWKSTPRKYKPSLIRMPNAAYKHKKKYIIEFDIERQDMITGETEIYSRRLGLDTLETRGETEDTMKYLATAYDKEVLAIKEARIFK